MLQGNDIGFVFEKQQHYTGVGAICFVYLRKEEFSLILWLSREEVINFGPCNKFLH
jgi:hypothetical protein